MGNLPVNIIVLAITISWIKNSNSKLVKETNLQDTNSNHDLKTENDGNGEMTVATTKVLEGDSVKITDDNITGKKKGAPDILGQDTIGKGTPNLTASRRKRDNLRMWGKKTSSKLKRKTTNSKLKHRTTNSAFKHKKSRPLRVQICFWREPLKSEEKFFYDNSPLVFEEPYHYNESATHPPIYGKPTIYDKYT